MTDKLKELIAKAERIGVIGSPSSTSELALDIMAQSVNKKLVGELAFFPYQQDVYTNYALGQITEVKLRNIWHEDPTIRSLIRQRGTIDAVSERQDTHQGEMIISAVFANSNGNYKPSILGTVPATGTPIYLANDALLDELLSPYKSQLFYLGNVYGSQPKLPLWFKHFGSGLNGAGEAYHIGVFGKTGSGKSVLSKMLILAYARHKNMGLFVFDPQGEFSKGLTNTESELSIGNILHPKILSSFDRDFSVYDLSKFCLGTWELFGELLLENNFFGTMGIKTSDYQNQAATFVIDALRNSSKYKLTDINKEAFVASLGVLDENINRIYATSAGIDRVRGFIEEAREKLASDEETPLYTIWKNVAPFFSTNGGRLSISQIVNKIFANNGDKRPVIILDLSKKPDNIQTGVWDDKIKPLLIDAFLSVLIRTAEKAFQNDEGLNSLVVLDEAHRLAPQERIENERKKKIKINLIDAVRTTRKYGLGWMFLSQTLSSLDNEIVQQLRISFYGFGLSMGTEYRKLQEIVGGKGEYLKLYQQFRDPHSSFDIKSREYSFMTIGPVSPLSFAGTPLFLNAYTTLEEFCKANDLQIEE